jgi:hypothetical protein
VFSDDGVRVNALFNTITEKKIKVKKSRLNIQNVVGHNVFCNGSSGLTALEALRGRGSGDRAGGPSAKRRPQKTSGLDV